MIKFWLALSLLLGAFWGTVAYLLTHSMLAGAALGLLAFFAVVFAGSLCMSAGE